MPRVPMSRQIRARSKNSWPRPELTVLRSFFGSVGGRGLRYSG